MNHFHRNQMDQQKHAKQQDPFSIRVKSVREAGKTQKSAAAHGEPGGDNHGDNARTNAL